MAGSRQATAAARRRTEQTSAVLRSVGQDTHAAAGVPLGARTESEPEPAVAASAALPAHHGHRPARSEHDDSERRRVHTLHRTAAADTRGRRHRMLRPVAWPRDCEGPRRVRKHPREAHRTEVYASEAFGGDALGAAHRPFLPHRHRRMDSLRPRREGAHAAFYKRNRHSERRGGELRHVRRVRLCSRLRAGREGRGSERAEDRDTAAAGRRVLPFRYIARATLVDARHTEHRERPARDYAPRPQAPSVYLRAEHRAEAQVDTAEPQRVGGERIRRRKLDADAGQHRDRRAGEQLDADARRGSVRRRSACRHRQLGCASVQLQRQVPRRPG